MTAEELKKFINDHMEAAVARSMGDTGRGAANEPLLIELITYVSLKEGEIFDTSGAALIP